MYACIGSDSEIPECEADKVGETWLPAEPDHDALDCGCDLPIVDLSAAGSFETVFALWDKVGARSLLV